MNYHFSCASTLDGKTCFYYKKTDFLYLKVGVVILFFLKKKRKEKEIKPYCYSFFKEKTCR